MNRRELVLAVAERTGSDRKTADAAVAAVTDSIVAAVTKGDIVTISGSRARDTKKLQAHGKTLVHDWMYELRLFALEQLSGMRADLFLCDPHRIIVTGRRQLRGRILDSRDLRSGMALIAAALAADGESRVAPLETVERGYGTLVERLRKLAGAVSQGEDLAAIKVRVHPGRKRS